MTCARYPCARPRRILTRSARPHESGDPAHESQPAALDSRLRGNERTRSVPTQQERALQHLRILAAAGFAAAVATAPALALDISGAGATFPYPIYGKWADAYKKE